MEVETVVGPLWPGACGTVCVVESSEPESRGSAPCARLVAGEGFLELTFLLRGEARRADGRKCPR